MKRPGRQTRRLGKVPGQEYVPAEDWEVAGAFGLDPVAVLSRIAYLSEERDVPGWMRVDELIRYSRAFYPAWDDAYAEESTEATNPCTTRSAGFSIGRWGSRTWRSSIDHLEIAYLAHDRAPDVGTKRWQTLILT